MSSTSEKLVHSVLRSLERRRCGARVIVALLGAGKRGLAARRRMAAALARRGILALVPEDDLPEDAAPSLAERAILSSDDVDLVFINVESWGSAVEFGQFHENEKIAPKLRVLVSPEHHPFHGESVGYLADLYLSHLSMFGHVYAVNGEARVRLPSTWTLVRKLSERYRQIKTLGG